MPKPYGISGTPWHVEQVHNNDPTDSRRHRSRCMFYVSETKACKKNSSCCYGASHCEWYREKTADLVEEEETVASKTSAFQKKNPNAYLANRPLPLKKELSSITPQKQNTQTGLTQKVRRGSLIGFGNNKFFVWDIKQDEDLQFIYICKPVVENRTGKAKENKYWLFSKWVLSDESVEISSDRVRSVEQLTPNIANRILGKTQTQNAATPIKKREVRSETKNEPKAEQYTFVLTEDGKSPVGKQTKNIYIDVYYQSKLKHIPGFEDPIDKKIYIWKPLYEKYKSRLHGPKGFFISAR